MNDIDFVDTTLRDGDQSLWGYTTTTGMILPIATLLDQSGFRSVEPDGLISAKTRIRELHEEPWDRMSRLARIMTRTPLSVMSGCSAGQFGVAPLAFRKLRLECIAAKGIRRTQITGFLNDMRFMVPETLQHARKIGLETVLGLVYTVSPKHTDEYYARKTREALQLQPDRLYLKDPGGLLTPERIKTIIPAILAESGDVPVELHSHCTTGLGPLCYLEAMQLGIRTFHTGIPPLANGPALPSVLNVARNARLLGFNPQIDEELVKRIADHFRFIARREGRVQGAPLEYDYGQYLHQTPGGVISNLKRQLGQMRMGGRLDDVLRDTIQVRQDLGYPIMVTPFSQHVVTQATINVMLGERYRQVTDELLQFCLGYFGEEASSGVDPEVKEMILSRPRAKELADRERTEPSLAELHDQVGGGDLSDDEFVLRYMLGGDSDLKAMRPAPPIREYPLLGNNPLLVLVAELGKRKELQHLELKKNGLSLLVKKQG